MNKILEILKYSIQGDIKFDEFTALCGSTNPIIENSLWCIDLMDCIDYDTYEDEYLDEEEE